MFFPCGIFGFGLVSSFQPITGIFGATTVTITEQIEATGSLALRHEAAEACHMHRGTAASDPRTRPVMPRRLAQIESRWGFQKYIRTRTRDLWVVRILLFHDPFSPGQMVRPGKQPFGAPGKCEPVLASLLMDLGKRRVCKFTQANVSAPRAGILDCQWFRGFPIPSCAIHPQAQGMRRGIFGAETGKRVQEARACYSCTSFCT